MGRGRSLQKFLQGLQDGDPVAYGLLGFLALLLAVAGVIWLVDLKRRRAEEAGAKGSRRGR